MDLTESIAPRSDQLNADDLMAGPVTVTIESVDRGNAEQPVNVHLREFPGRPFRPSKSMRRVMVAAWGKESGTYAGQRMTLYRDPEITFGREKVGGIRISHMTGIDGRMELALTVTRGRRSPYVVQPLAAASAPPEPTAEQVAACTDLTALRRMHDASGPEMRALILARRDELTQGGAA